MKNLLCIKENYNLVRIGRENDGGYLVEKESLMNSKFLVGMGLNDDWSFEKNFTLLNKVKVHVYDHTVNHAFWIAYYKEILNHIFLLTCYLPRVFKYFQYLLFFRSNQHFKECIGQETSLKKVFSRIDSYPIFLKIDIEGSEYDILEDLVVQAENISGLVIEFHSVNLFWEKIYKFISNFNLKLVHIHGNNFGGKSAKGYPIVIEMTFSKNPKPINRNEPTLPNKLDMPNNPYLEELDLNLDDFPKWRNE